MKFRSLAPWLPGMAAVAAAGVFCIIYALTGSGKAAVYVELAASSLLPFIFPLYGVISKKRLPTALGVLAALFVTLSGGFGSALGFYEKIPVWDSVLHGVFGFACSFTAFALLLRWNGRRLSPVGFMAIILLFTMGVAALWELLEYLIDLMTGWDSQKIAASVAEGKSPVADTMEDMISALVGTAAFYLTLLADKLLHHGIYGPICDFHGFEKGKE